MTVAIVKLLPRKAAPTKSRLQSMADQHDYNADPDKTRNGEFISSYMCQPESAAAEFEASKLIYEATTGRSQPKSREVTMYRLVQSFKPGETTAEEANQIGYELAMQFTKGQHQFVVYTHEDKSHIHNHIEINSTNLDCDCKFKNEKNSVAIVRELNDKICQAHDLSIPKPKRRKAKSHGEMGAIMYGKSFKERLRNTIDTAIPGCMDFEEFLARMRAEGYEIKRRGKSLEFRAPEQLRFTRSFRLGDEYTESALRERIAEPRQKPRYSTDKKVNLLIDIQAKMKAGKGKGYERWATVHNLKEAAKTLLFLTEKGISDYDELAARAEEAGAKFDFVSTRIKQLEGRMAEVAQLKTHIINYSKTRDVYAAFKKSRHKKEYRAEHTDELQKHEAAKAAFDALGSKAIPKVTQLSGEYAALLAEKKERYLEYKTVRKEMIDFQTAKQNIDRILGIGPEQEKQKERGR